jgi:hypothetical protein
MKLKKKCSPNKVHYLWSSIAVLKIIQKYVILQVMKDNSFFTRQKMSYLQLNRRLFKVFFVKTKLISLLINFSFCLIKCRNTPSLIFIIHSILEVKKRNKLDTRWSKKNWFQEILINNLYLLDGQNLGFQDDMNVLMGLF